ncbi:MAG: hypothetical protein Kow00108_26460 [Calditrichia bacterium]
MSFNQLNLRGHMKANGNTVEEILNNLPEDRKEPFNRLHQVIMNIYRKDLNLQSVTAD